MNIIDAINTRYSVREYLDKPVAQEVIQSILQAALRAPSGTNTQPWQIAVVSGKVKLGIEKDLLAAFDSGELKNMDYKYYPDEFIGEMKRRRIECGLAMFNTLKISREDKLERLNQWRKNYQAFGAPVVIYCFIDKKLERGSYLDYGMFIQNIMLAALEFGLGSCPQAALAEYPDIVRRHLHIDDNQILLCGIALGYPKSDALINSYRTSRDDLSLVCKF